MTTPLPSELVEEWMSRVDRHVSKGLAGQRRQEAVADGFIAGLQFCARELQASLEAMQREGGE